MTVTDPSLIANLITRVQAAKIEAQNLVNGSFMQNSPQSRQAFMLTYLRLHDTVEQLLNDARVPVTGLDQLQTARHRSLVAEQVPPQSLYREVAGETAIMQRVMDELLATLSATSSATPVTTPAGIAFTSDSGKTYTYQPTQTLGPPGRFSQVYRGADEAGRAVAVKRLQIRADSTRHRTADEQQAERELQVARQLATVSDSHIMPIIDSAHLDGELLLVMPLADYSLADAIRDHGRLRAPEIKELLRQTASAMQELATASIVHRDIKPGNILWHEGRWRLADFGISRITSAVTATYTFRGTGTLEYLAPEAWNFGPQTVASDLYALGCVGFEAAAGQRAFDGNDLAQLHATHTPILPADTDPALAKVINLLLAKHPDQRPPDARKVLELLSIREGLTDGQRSLQRLSAAAAQRNLERAGQEAALIQRHGRQERAYTALSALWRDLMDEVRQAVPDAQGAEEADNRTLTVGDTRLRIRMDDAPPSNPGQVLLTAEVFVDSVGTARPRMAANLVCLWQNDHPEWHLAQFYRKAMPGASASDPDLNAPSGIPADAAYRPWNSGDPVDTQAVATVVRADPATIIDLIARETGSAN